ncbi:acetyl-CoA carboxylase biotin carboxyl carrier protein subunit [Pedobacter fastidiosus]|uniref:Acetyl-CoA carboxylase biotin carboxyl carrier protein subunit n=1 Tax=Pedobacter fastidiosus TaxID=2765361 RepID=A0ABR7KRB5_9SPHI|nr:acetyl-CoA carboxylase biotin carboxyl carrier protein subunit [Pedobacter fastidiosus]MBC6110637.1 acetyl-CoA carboxylase biotin carboxyl carrier protein subunit [Pedobacter fastidiosus]
MHKVKVNESFNFEIDKKGTDLFIDNELLKLDLSDLGNHATHVIYKNKSFNTEVVEVNMPDKTCTIKVNGNIYSLKIEDQFDQLLKQLGLDNLASAKVLEIKAPMPGLVLKVIVEEGMEIKKGDNLLILEAMKMENILKSSTDGIIKKISVKQGDKVEKNQILIQFK